MLPSPNPFADRVSQLDLRCRECGYGIAAKHLPEICPMCHSSESWGPLNPNWLRIEAIANAS